MFKKIILCLVLLSNLALCYTLSECTKLFSKDADTVFLNALSALNSSSLYEVSEIQTKNGCIFFIYNSKLYLLTVTKRYKNQTEVKILPDNSEFDDYNIAPNIFSLIEKTVNMEQRP